MAGAASGPESKLYDEKRRRAVGRRYTTPSPICRVSSHDQPWRSPQGLNTHKNKISPMESSGDPRAATKNIPGTKARGEAPARMKRMIGRTIVRGDETYDWTYDCSAPPRAWRGPAKSQVLITKKKTSPPYSV